MLICFSYYCAHDLPQWTELLAGLNDKMEASHTRRPSRASGNVILMGAPIYFPNYKIPFLLQDVGLHVAAHLDYTTRRAVAGLTIEETADITLSGLGQRFYQADCSGSYAKNGTLQAAASELLDSCDVDGVVYCVLKARHGRKEGRFTGREHGAWYLLPLPPACPTRNRRGPLFRPVPRFERKGSADMKIELNYVKVGDYYLPALTIGPPPDRSLGKYGLLRLRYLKEHRPIVWADLVTEGKLYAHLLEVEDAAQNLLDSMMPQMAKAAGTTEDLKA